MSELSLNIINCLEKVIRNKNSFEKVALHEPYFEDTNAWRYVKECIDTGWVSSAGEWVNKFEDGISKFTGASYAVAVTNGTVGLRLALYAIGVRCGDEVLIPPLSFVATANAVSHLGATPHFVDVEKDSLGLSPIALEKRLEEIAYKKNGKVFNKVTGKRIAALIPVHVFGNPANLPELLIIANKWGIPIVEDAAEALGSWFKVSEEKIHCGLIGDIGVISFNGNKLITTGGGGVLITNNSELASKLKHLSSTAKIPHPWEFDHDEIAWNDRLPNLNAALGCAQLEVIENRLLVKKKLFDFYKNSLNHLTEIDFISGTSCLVTNNWLITLYLKFDEVSRLKTERYDLLDQAHKRNLLLRPLWKPLHKLGIYNNAPRGSLCYAENFEFRIINLPSSPQLIN